MKLRLLFFLAGLLVLFLVVRRWPDARSRGPTENLHETRLARHLLARGNWQTHAAPTGHIHYRAGTYAAGTLPQISAALDSARKAVLNFLQLRDAEPIEVFLVDSRDEMGMLVGRPLGGMVQFGERTALLLYNQTYSPFLTHELTHLYTHHHWGAPRTGRWISEGIAALAAGGCQGHSLAALVKGLHDDGRLSSWARLIAEFDSIDEIAGNLQAASMVEFLRQRHGLRAVRNIWMTKDWQPAPGLEPAWRARVRSGPAGARLDPPRLHAAGCVP